MKASYLLFIENTAEKKFLCDFELPASISVARAYDMNWYTINASSEKPDSVNFYLSESINVIS